MQQYKRDFIDFMVRSGVLTFGDFTAKSGRKTPYFVNAGNYDNGAQIGELGRYYAKALNEHLGAEFDNLYGPAYKGIPLCVTTSIALAESYEHTVTFTFNRKEAKDHGEGGSLVGYKYKGGERSVIIEDVTTAGTSVRESIPLMKSISDSVNIIALIVSVDRQEKGKGNRAALTELAEEFGIETFAIVTIDEIIEHLKDNTVDGNQILDEELLGRIEAYREQYGAK